MRKKSKVVSIMFDEDKYSAKEARAWLDKHGYERKGRVEKGKTTRKYKFKSGKIEGENFRTIRFGKDSGIKAVVNY